MDHDLLRARAELAAFRNRIDDRTMLRRLADEAPFHPLLIAVGALQGLAVATGTAGFLMLVGPLVHARVAELIALYDPLALGAPALVLVAICAGVAAWSVRRLAVQRGTQSPLLPEEARYHQELATHMLRLQCSQRR